MELAFFISEGPALETPASILMVPLKVWVKVPLAGLLQVLVRVVEHQAGEVRTYFLSPSLHSVCHMRPQDLGQDLVRDFDCGEGIFFFSCRGEVFWCGGTGGRRGIHRKI